MGSEFVRGFFGQSGAVFNPCAKSRFETQSLSYVSPCDDGELHFDDAGLFGRGLVGGGFGVRQVVIRPAAS